MTQKTMVFTDEEKRRAKSNADRILDMLLIGKVCSTKLLDVTHRFSACIKNLRERGYVINVVKQDDGTSMHELVDYVAMVEVTDEWKAAYYLSEHWTQKRRDRLIFDDWKCCHCRSTSELQVHHWKYDLFNESIEDLVTLCNVCHERIHEYNAVKLSFPSHVRPDVWTLITPQGAAQ